MTPSHVAMIDLEMWIAIPAEPCNAHGYWCVICGRRIIPDDDGVILHDEVRHPEIMRFDDELLVM